jgi:superfamily II DNA or RNA helicase
MSKLVLVKDIKKHNKTNKIMRDCKVQEVQKFSAFSGGGGNAFYQKRKEIETFDLFDPDGTADSNKIRVALPFSYFYHNCSDIPTILFNQPKIKMDFNGSLLPRQKLIRDDIFSILNRTNSILLCLHTGFGKTIFALYIASKIKMKTIVLCHRKIIIDQWVNAVKKYLPDVTVEVLNPKKKPTADIVIGNVLTVPKCNENDSYRSTFSEYGTLLLDEVHTVCTEQFSKALFHIFPQWLIGLSATPHRSDGMDKLIQLYVGPEGVYKDMWRIFNVYKLPTGFVPEIKRNNDGSIEWNSALSSQANSKTRNEMIVKLVQYFKSRKILVLVKRTDHANALKEMLFQAGDDVDTFMESDKSANFNCRVLIATYSKGGVGFDHPGLDMLIGAADVEENFMQYLGRVFRKDDTAPIYVDLIDDNPIMKKHSTTRIKICTSVGGVIRKFNDCFPNEELRSP